MNTRCDLNVNGGSRRILLAAKDEETAEHIALRLAAAILFFDQEPALETGPSDPVTADIGFFPDLLVPDGTGGVGVWVECGNVAVNKLTKVARRIKTGRLVILKESVEAGRRMREVINKEVTKSEKVEVWAWPKEEFARWTAAITESNYVFGEASGSALNLVLNEAVFATQLTVC
ncbi:MAG TPA: YaeQ family protein [Elusimicrobiales bacterium]|nr:YaeQ family protein [Elusimicrobiales bacterium]